MSAPRFLTALACFLAPALSLAQTPPPIPPAAMPSRPAQKTIGVPSARKRSESLIVLNARGAQLAGGTLTLENVAPSAILFTQPSGARRGAHAHHRAVELWATGSFRQGPPNATVSAFAKDGSKVTDAVVVLRSPKAAATSSPSTSRC